MKRVTNYSYGSQDLQSFANVAHNATVTNFILEFEATQIKVHVQIYGLQKLEILILTLNPIFATTTLRRTNLKANLIITAMGGGIT